MLADARLQTQCTDAQGRRQPLAKCADPASEFQKAVRRDLWRGFLKSWLEKGNAHKACEQLLQLQEEDAQAWQHQVYLAYTHLDTSKQPSRLLAKH